MVLGLAFLSFVCHFHPNSRSLLGLITNYNKNNNKKTVNDKPTEENQNFINMEELLKNNRKLDKVQEEESL